MGEVGGGREEEEMGGRRGRGERRGEVGNRRWEVAGK